MESRFHSSLKALKAIKTNHLFLNPLCASACWDILARDVNSCFPREVNDTLQHSKGEERGKRREIVSEKKKKVIAMF